MLSTMAARLRLVRSSSPIRKRLTADDDSRSSHNAAGRAARSDSARAQSRTACAAGPMVPSIDSGQPTTSPAAPSFRAILPTSAAAADNLPRGRLP